MPESLSRSALLIIDMQRDFCSAGGYAAQAGPDVTRLSSVIADICSVREAS